MTSPHSTRQRQLKEIRTEINRLSFSLQQIVFLQIRDDLDELARSLLEEGCSVEEVIATFRPESDTAIQYRLTRVIVERNPVAVAVHPNDAREVKKEEA